MFGFGKKHKENAIPADREIPLEKMGVDLSSWFEVYSACLGKMVTVQNACGELVVKGRNWNVDFSAGVIQFGEDKYPLQFLGSESSSSGTWLWGWDNVNNFPDRLIVLPQQTKAKGDRYSLEPLAAATFELTDTFNGHSLSTVACGLSTNYCYYRCPHSNGAAFVAFGNLPASVFAPVSAERFVTTAMECIQQLHIDHKIFIEGFLHWNNVSFEWVGSKLLAHFEQELAIEFEQVDGLLRVCSVKSC